MHAFPQHISLFPEADISTNMNDIDAALAALEPGVPIDYTKLAEELGIYRFIVSRRHRGKTTSRTDYRENASLLSNEQ